MQDTVKKQKKKHYGMKAVGATILQIIWLQSKTLYSMQSYTEIVQGFSDIFSASS